MYNARTKCELVIFPPGEKGENTAFVGEFALMLFSACVIPTVFQGEKLRIIPPLAGMFCRKKQVYLYLSIREHICFSTKGVRGWVPDSGVKTAE